MSNFNDKFLIMKKKQATYQVSKLRVFIYKNSYMFEDNIMKI